MQLARALGAVAAIAAATSALADQVQAPIDLGPFGFLDGGRITGDGPFAPDIDVTFVCEAPIRLHRDEPAAPLGERVRSMDSVSGAADARDHTHVARGERGRLNALLGQPTPLMDLPPGAGPALLLSMVATTEFLRVRVLALLPTPGSLVLLTVAAIFAYWPRCLRG